MSLRRSYTLLAPLYDLVADRAFRSARRASLAPLQTWLTSDVFLNGVGTGLDLAFLPPRHRYTALDITRAMLRRAQSRTHAIDVAWIEGDSERLPLGNERFDCVVMHLIVAVVARPHRALVEAARVLRRGGTILVFDKFLAPGESAPLRRLLNPLASRVATRTDVIFEAALESTPELRIVSDEPALGRGWFRRIVLEKI